MKFKSHYSNKNSEMTNGCRKWRNRFKREKCLVLAEYFEQQTDCYRYKNKIRKSRRGPLWRNQPNLFTFSYQTNGNHAMELSTVGHVISERHKYFQFHWNCKQPRVEARNSMSNCQIYFTLFSETIHTILKIFSKHGLRKCR